MTKGLIHIYTGNGKGKTTAAMGLALRAVGAGLLVHMVQFMKGRRYSEIDAIEKITGFTVKQFGRDEFVSKKNPAQIDIDFARDGLKYAKDAASSGRYDVVILDEINVAVDFNLIALADVLALIKNKNEETELILTGRYAPKEFIDAADLVTEMKEIKHPYQRGIDARKGIDW